MPSDKQEKKYEKLKLTHTAVSKITHQNHGNFPFYANAACIPKKQNKLTHVLLVWRKTFIRALSSFIVFLFFSARIEWINKGMNKK